MSLSRDPFCRWANVIVAVNAVLYNLPAEHWPEALATPDLLETPLDAIRAYEQARQPDDANQMAVWISTSMLACVAGNVMRDEDNAKMLRKVMGDAAPAIRYLLDHPVSMTGADSSTQLALRVASELWRCYEEDAGIELTAQDIDDYFRTQQAFLDGSVGGSSFQLSAEWSVTPLNLCVCDALKQLLVDSTFVRPHLILGLFLDPEEHPLGANAAAPTPEATQEVWQRNCTEALEQLALFEPGKIALAQDAQVMEALHAVSERGMCEEARESARGALLALSDEQPDRLEEVADRQHVMLSYQWNAQAMIVRINESLQRRMYRTWIDLEKCARLMTKSFCLSC